MHKINNHHMCYCYQRIGFFLFRCGIQINRQIITNSMGPLLVILQYLLRPFFSYWFGLMLKLPHQKKMY